MKNILRECLGDLILYMKNQGLEVDPLPRLHFNNQPQEEPILSTTGTYDPSRKVITVYTNGRHPKDVLRSFAHEMIHHNQNITGQLYSEDMDFSPDDNYAQNNAHLRKMEEDAYRRGNMLFRDWSDNRKKR